MWWRRARRTRSRRAPRPARCARPYSTRIVRSARRTARQFLQCAASRPRCRTPLARSVRACTRRARRSTRCRAPRRRRLRARRCLTLRVRFARRLTRRATRLTCLVRRSFPGRCARRRIPTCAARLRTWNARRRSCPAVRTRICRHAPFPRRDRRQRSSARPSRRFVRRQRRWPASRAWWSVASPAPCIHARRRLWSANPA